jgi:hypothetical protein
MREFVALVFSAFVISIEIATATLYYYWIYIPELEDGVIY